jgi:hypothetical protein
MSFSNLSKNKILNGRDSQGAFPDNSPMGDGYIYLKYAWEVQISNTDISSAPPLVAKTCELPRWTAETQVVNVYNHKTIVQTKLNYEPITMSFYDQVNGAAEKLIWDYVKGQFDSTDGSKKADFQPLTIKITMKTLSGDGTPDKVYTLKNAFITDAQHDTLDYATSDVVLWTITVRYEDIETGEFNEPTPKTSASIPPLPKPPKTVPQINKKIDVPTTKPPPADAQVERNKWVEAGGTETGGGAATGNPYMTNQTRLGNPNIRPGSLRDRAARANAARAAGEKPEQTTPWPESRSGASEATYDAMGNVTGYSPSTGTPAPAKTNKQRELTPKQKDFVAQESAYVKDDAGMNPEYKKAYLESLAKHPPVTNSLQSQEAAKQIAATEALRTAPRYSAQTRTVDNGVITDRVNLSKLEPAPSPTRDGTTLSTNKSNDAKGNAIATTQVQREQQLAKRSKGRDY